MLPNFQREWVWNEDQVRGLTEAVCVGQPIGGIMRITRTSVDFEYRPFFDGVKVSNVDPVPEFLVMDGQQRLTTLFQVFGNTAPVRVHFRKGFRRILFYFDIKHYGSSKDIAGSIRTVIVDSKTGKPADEELRDIQSEATQFARCWFPLGLTMDFEAWKVAYDSYWISRSGSSELGDAMQFFNKIPSLVKHASIPIITMLDHATIGDIAVAYGNLNSKGTQLDAFELLIAKYAAGNFDLRADWFGINGEPGVQKTISEVSKGLIKDIQPTEYLPAVQHYLNIARGTPSQGVSKKVLLEIKAADYREAAKPVLNGYKEAFAALTSASLLTPTYLPAAFYLSAMCAILGDSGRDCASADVRGKLFKWYYGTTLVKKYRGGDPLFAGDVLKVAEWIRGNTTTPEFLAKINVTESLVLGAQGTKFATSILISEGARDFATSAIIKDHFFSESSFDVHHIFPKKWCKDEGIPEALYNSIYNKTPLSSDTNQRVISDRPPSIYLYEIEIARRLSSADMDNLLISARIDPSTIRNDDFYGLIRERRSSILTMMKARLPGTFTDGDFFASEPQHPRLPSYLWICKETLAFLFKTSAPAKLDDIVLHVLERFSASSCIGDSVLEDIFLERLRKRVSWCLKYLTTRDKSVRLNKKAYTFVSGHQGMRHADEE